MGQKLPSAQIFYEWRSLIFTGKVQNLVMLDLVVHDEFGEPFSYICTPIEVKQNERLFENQLNFEMQTFNDTESMKVSSILFQSI